MNGLIKLVIDTNVIFMSLYNPNSKAGFIIDCANKNKIILYSTDTVKEEIIRVLKRELNLINTEIKFIIENLSIKWIEKEIYEKFLKKTKVKHKPDKPVKALALLLNCSILSANKHFKERENINKLIEKLK